MKKLSILSITLIVILLLSTSVIAGQIAKNNEMKNYTYQTKDLTKSEMNRAKSSDVITAQLPDAQKIAITLKKKNLNYDDIDVSDVSCQPIDANNSQCKFSMKKDGIIDTVDVFTSKNEDIINNRDALITANLQRIEQYLLEESKKFEQPAVIASDGFKIKPQDYVDASKIKPQDYVDASKIKPQDYVDEPMVNVLP